MTTMARALCGSARVAREWMGPFERDPGFWNPKNRGPDCYNLAAARTVPFVLITTKLVLAGEAMAEVKEGIKAAIEKKEVPALEPSGTAYMMSKQGYLNDAAEHWLPHLMFYVPPKDSKTRGAGAPDSPVMVNPHFNGAPEPVTEFMIPVFEWSDGTPADTEGH